MRRIRRRRMKRTLAVSTVVANLMMITITLGLAAILIAWTGSTYGLFTSGSQIFFQQRGQALQERFTIENVFLNTTDDCGGQACKRLLIFVRNDGAEELTVVAIYVYSSQHALPSGKDGRIDPASGTCGLTLPTTISVGQVCEFNLNFGVNYPSPPLKTGDNFYIIVASARGNRATFTVRIFIAGT